MILFLNEKVLRLGFEIYIPVFGLEAYFVLYQPRDAVGGGVMAYATDRHEGEGGNSGLNSPNPDDFKSMNVRFEKRRGRDNGSTPSGLAAGFPFSVGKTGRGRAC